MAGEGFEKTTFGQLIADGALEIGDGYRAKNEELGGDGLIFLRAGHVTDTHIDFEGAERFHAALESRVRSKLARPGDAVVTTKGNSTGRTTYVTSSMPSFVYSPHLSYWRSIDTNRIEGGFLRYWSKGPEFAAQLVGMKASTDMAPYLSLVDQRRLQITLPPPAEQRAIAHILGTLDDKIELNRRMNETLESMARAIFKSWFVDFDPLRAKVKELASDGILEIGDGYRAKNDELGEMGLPFIRAANLNDGFDTDNAERLRKESVARAGTKISRAGDVAFTSKGTIGRVARVGEMTERFVYSPQICYWRSLDNARLHPAVLYCWMQTDDFRAQILAVAGQTDMAPYVSLRDQREMLVPQFPSAQAEIGAKIDALLVRQSLNYAESRTLATLRDTLLPKLISGELRVKGAERFIEEKGV
jgi:type I restriction enzyme S subunit